MEIKIIKSALSSKESFLVLEKFDVFQALSDHGKILYEYIKEFYNTDLKAKSVDLDLLKNKIERDLPKQKVLFFSILERLPKEDISFPNLFKEIVEIRKEDVGRKLSSILLSGDKAQAPALIEQYTTIEASLKALRDDDDVMVGVPIGDIVSRVSQANKIRLWPKALNDRCDGGVVRGNNILIFGRPEVGKSLFAINLCGGFLYDGYKVLFIENEDPTDITMSRIICRLSEKTIHEVIELADKLQKDVDAKGYKNLVFKSMSPGTFHEIQGLIDQHKPDIVIINQLRNIYCGKCERVIQLERAATNSRNLAKKNNIVVVGISQAGDSADNKLVLEMGDIDFSNTGMPSQMDLIIGVGINPDFESKGQRMISLPKNKLGEHSYFPVIVDTKISKIISI